ncbi:MAG: hypothetical protein PHW87_11060 [Methanothrix sp.]|nr:hypothetical protein [Methanothrix sp.]
MKKISFGEDGRTHRFFGDFTAHLVIDKLQLVRENQAARMPKIPQEALPGLLKTDLSSGRKPKSSPPGLESPADLIEPRRLIRRDGRVHPLRSDLHFRADDHE